MGCRNLILQFLAIKLSLFCQNHARLRSDEFIAAGGQKEVLVLVETSKMTSDFSVWKNWSTPCVLILVFVLATATLSAKNTPVQNYIQRLEQSHTPGNFNVVFAEMMTEMKSGKMEPFTETDVMSILTIARKKPFAESLLPAVYGWAGSMFGDGRMDEALKYFMESAQLYERKNKDLAQALSCFEIAMIHHKAKNFDEAKMYYEKTLQLGKDSLDHRTRINCLNGFGLIHQHQGEFDKARRAFRTAYKVAESYNDRVWMGILAGNIGGVHMSLASYDSSLYYYFKNLGLVRNTLEFENEIEAYSQLGRIFLLKSDFEKAKLYLDSACSIVRERKIKFTDFFNPMDHINKNYADMYAAMGDFKLAYDYYQKYHDVAVEKQTNVNGHSLKYLQSEFAFKQKTNEVDMLKKINEANILLIKQQRFIGTAFVIIIMLLGVWAYNAYKTGQQRKTLNKELHKSNLELARLNAVKDRLFSVISHDLRSPIATLKSILTFLRNGHLREDEAKDLYARLNNQLQACGNVLENLLQWAKTELTSRKSGAEKVILADVVNEVALQLKDDIEEKKIQLRNELNFQLIALADKIQVEIILRNLMANAVKFTSSGGQVKIAGKVNEHSIEVCVEDNGLGMHEEEVKNLFHPGKHFSTRGTNQETGSGIGLLITKEMISKNGGNIWVSSRKHEGTIFTFTLPLAS
jgi:two-component system sensor histidine kinase/response regulator